MPSPNPVKYSAGTETIGSIKKGTVALGIQDTDYVSTPSSGFWNGLNHPAESGSGYIIYKADNITPPLPYDQVPMPSGTIVKTDQELINAANGYGAMVTTLRDALSYLNSLSNTMVVNRNYENIVTSNLYMLLDVGFTACHHQGTSGTVYDLSGNGRNGTLTASAGNAPVKGVYPGFTTSGMASYAGNPGGAMSLANHANIQIGSLPVNDSAYTLQYIFRIAGDNSYGNTIMGTTGADGNSNGHFLIRIGSGASGIIRLQSNFITDFTPDISTASAISLNTTYMITFVINKATSSITWYLNTTNRGTLTSVAATGYSSLAAYSFFTTGYAIGTNNYFASGTEYNGNIYWFAFYQKALTAAEVSQNYNALKSRYTGL